jgi:hypothetical protein
MSIIKRIALAFNFTFIILLAPDLFAASSYKEIRSLQEEKKSLVALYKRKQKESPPGESSGITMRLHEIQAELDELTGGRKLEPNEHEVHGHRQNRSARNSSSSRNY